MEEYDNYYRSRRGSAGLPVFKITVNDADGSVWYIDPKTTKFRYFNSNSRLHRWLYKGLHSFDIKGLVDNRPLWDIVMIVLSIGGIFVSLSALVLTKRWLKRKI